MQSQRTNHRYLYLAFALFTLLAIAVALGRGEATAGASSGGNTAKLASAEAISKIETKVLQDTANGQSASFIVLMADRANLDAAYGMRDHDARGWYVYNTLRAHADRTQVSIRASLTALGVKYRVFWISNALIVTGDRTLVESIAARADVRRIESDREFRGIEPIRPTQPSNDTSSPNAPEWGVLNVRAPEVWAMGHRGQAIVVGNQDTGMRWTHQAIKNQYRGWNGTSANHNYNWWDSIHISIGNPCGFSSPEPCDDDDLLGGGHGTHTTGSATGDDGAGNQIGVAPQAKWIGCRNMDRGVGRPQTYLECFEFFLAPWDLAMQNPDPTKRPHVMNNSWVCVEGCAPETLHDAVRASQAAGIFVEVSAGNDGPSCSTIAFPPQIYEESFDTGAIDINNNLARFSSRGPVLSDGSMRLKPNVAAPGVNVRSSLRGSDTAYGALSGTSMAGPHTVGVVALLWSARPDLVRQITETKRLIERSANPMVIVQPVENCGGTPSNQVPNNSFGWGRVDALAAIAQGQATVTPLPTVTAQPTFTVGTPRPSSTPASPLPTATTRPPTNTITATSITTAIVTATRTNTPMLPPPPTTPPATSTRTSTVTSTSTVAPTATLCTIMFTDVPVNHTFYPFIRCLACRGIISGYADGTFKPGNEITRGQIAKMVSNAAGFSEDPGLQIYEDVNASNTFYVWINRLSRRGHMGGYACGTVPEEPCVLPQNRPYFRPYSNATRGQLAKIVSNAAGIQTTPSGVFYTDVQEDNPFYVWIMRLTERGVMSGYECGSLGEPCDPQNRPYFRPFNNVTRGQASKIVSNTFYPGCETSSR